VRNKSKKGNDQCQPNDHERPVNAPSYSHAKEIDATSDVTRPVKKEVKVGRSIAADRRRKAKTKVDKGQGDRGDTKRSGNVVRRLVRKLTRG